MSKGPHFSNEGLNNIIVDPPFRVGHPYADTMLTHNGIVLTGAERLIVDSYEYTEEFLTQIVNCEIDLTDQLRLLPLLASLHQECTGSFGIKKQLKDLFYRAMKSVLDHVKEERERYELDSDGWLENCEQAYDYYGYPAYVRQVVIESRKAAILGMLEKFANQLGGQKEYRGDLYGESYIELKNGKNPEIIEHLEGTYEIEDVPCAKISSPTQKGFWNLSFYHVSKFNNRLSLDIAAYEAALPYLQKGLEMDARTIWELTN